MTMESISDVQYQILKGTFDEDLKLLSQAIKLRQKEAKSQLLYSLRAGDQVILSDLRPKLLCGVTATVVKTNRTTVSVTIGSDSNAPVRYHGQSRIPIACVSKVEV